MKPYFKAWNIKKERWEEVIEIEWSDKNIKKVLTVITRYATTRSLKDIHFYEKDAEESEQNLNAIELHLTVKP